MRGFGSPAEVALRKRAYVLAELEVRLAIVEELHPDYWPRWVSVLAECIEAGSPEYDADGPPYKLPARIENGWTRAVVDTAKGSHGAVLRSAILESLEQAHHDDFEEFFAEACSRCRCALSYPCAGVLGAGFCDELGGGDDDWDPEYDEDDDDFEQA